jgi:uncharacterized membrane protein
MHATIAFSSLPLFVGALLSDQAYARTYEVQWTNFASWLVAGGLVMAALALLWAVADILVSRAWRDRRGWIYLLLLLATVVLGFINSLVHAQDAWAAMPSATALSVIVVLLVAAASGLGLVMQRRRSA